MRSTHRWPVEHDPETGCELWRGAVDRDGYGRTTTNERAHRVSWIAGGGAALPPGVALDHLCRRRLCVAFHHLEPVRAAENTRRIKRAWVGAPPKQCPRGHRPETWGRTPEHGWICPVCLEAARARRAA